MDSKSLSFRVNKVGHRQAVLSNGNHEVLTEWKLALRLLEWNAEKNSKKWRFYTRTEVCSENWECVNSP